MTKNKERPQGRPTTSVFHLGKRFQKEWKEQFEWLLLSIKVLHNCNRAETFLSDRFDVSVYAIRQWSVRGIPLRFEEEIAELAGISLSDLRELQGRG